MFLQIVNSIFELILKYIPTGYRVLNKKFNGLNF